MPVRQSLSLAAQARTGDPRPEARSATARPPSPASPGRARLSPGAEGGRLELDPVATDALVEPQLKMGTTLSTAEDPESDTPELLARRASAAAYWRALQGTPEQRARDLERVAELEQRLAELQSQMQAMTGASAPGLAPSLNASAALAAASTPADATADMQRSRTTALIGGGVAVALGLGYVLWRGRRSKGRAQEAWWQEQNGETVPPPMTEGGALGALDGRDPESTTVEFVHVPETLMPASTQAAPTVSAASGDLPSSREPGAAYSSMFASLTPPIDEPMRSVTVEELIDLEQQADFFVVLGQDDAAIELLEGYVQHMLTGSPLPMLKLLEIYRRLGRRDDYERTRQAFDARYNAHAPAWDEDLQRGHSLSDYPEVVERLQALWTEPNQAMVVLEKSLTRPTEGGDTFDLPAYRELLMLYAVARDLAEPAARGHRVDVLLPLPDEDGAALADRPGAEDVRPLMATRPLTAQAGGAAQLGRELQVDLEVDVQLDDDLADPRSGQRAHSP